MGLDCKSRPTARHRTSAGSGSTNAKIQMAAIKNSGSRDLDFFLCRVANFL